MCHNYEKTATTTYLTFIIDFYLLVCQTLPSPIPDLELFHVDSLQGKHFSATKSKLLLKCNFSWKEKISNILIMLFGLCT